MTIKEYLKSIKETAKKVGNAIVIICPVCSQPEFFINLYSGDGQCRNENCQTKLSFTETAKKLGFPDEIESVSGGIIQFAIPPKKTNLENRTNQQDKSESRVSQSDLLVGIVENNQNIFLFHNDLKEPFVRVPVGSHHEIWPCKNKMLKRWLGKSLWDTQHKVANSDSLNSALNVIEGKACHGDKEYPLHNRVAWLDGVLWYDLSDSEWQVVKVAPSGWEVVSDAPILFRRYSHQKAQVKPIANGDIKRLLKFVNVTNEQQQLLLLVYAVSCFIPDFPHPIPIIYGSQGSAKSVLSKVLRRLIDPSLMEVIGFPRESSQLAQQLAHHWCLFFDNVSYVPEWLSDMLCKAVSGDGFSKRELYSDDDDIIYTFKRCIGINGINLVAHKPDLLERSILLELERVPESRRMQEQELWTRFEEDRPIILGGIFDVLSKAMSIKPTIQIQGLPRMADFAGWGCAIATALGYTQEQFLSAYHTNIKGQNEEVLGESLIATAIRKFMDGQAIWEGTQSELLSELTIIAGGIGINTEREKAWPKAANILGRRINELKTNLAEDGISMSRGMKEKQRIITLQNRAVNTVPIVESSPPESLVDKFGDNTGNGSERDLMESSPEKQPSLLGIDDRNDNDDIFHDF